MVTQTPSTVPAIGSTTEYTITCDVSVSCTGPCNDTLTISWSLNGNSINSTTLTDSNNSPFSVSSSGTFTSTLTTVGDIHLSHAGEYQCITSLITAGISDTNTTDFDVKCKLNTSSIIIPNNMVINFIVPGPSITVTNDTVEVGSTATLVCFASIISNMSGILYFSQWTGSYTLDLSEGINSTLVIENVDVDDAGQYMCIITACYTGSEVNTTYVMDAMNTASAYLTVKLKLVELILYY